MAKYDAYLDEETESIAREVINKERGLYSRIVREALLKWKAENISDEELRERIIQEEESLQQRSDSLRKLKDKKKTLDEVKKIESEKKKSDMDKISKKYAADVDYFAKHITKFYNLQKQLAKKLAEEYLLTKSRNASPSQYLVSDFLKSKSLRKEIAEGLEFFENNKEKELEAVS